MSKKLIIGIIISIACVLLTVAGTFFMYRSMRDFFSDMQYAYGSEPDGIRYSWGIGGQQGGNGSNGAIGGKNTPDNGNLGNAGKNGSGDKYQEDSGRTDTEEAVLSDGEKRKLFESKLDTIMDYIDYYYYEEIDDDVIYDYMLHAALYALEDPYSVYYSPKEFGDLLEASSGTYSGIGATVTKNVESGLISIVKPFIGSPAAEAGVLPEDIIFAVEGQEVTGLDLSYVVSLLKGPAGTDVNVTFLREEEKIDIKITRQTINVQFVSHRMLENDIGYIMVSEFEETTAKQFKDAIDDLTKKGMKGLVIDLRDNPGGLYDICVEMLDRIAPKGSLLVYTEDKYGNKESEYAQTEDKLEVPLVVLVNGNSASASEIFAGAVQDLKLGTIIGTQSFGKGIVQSVIPIMDDLSGIKVTSSRYFTPRGVCIHGIGIEPDKKVELDEDLKKTLIEKRDHDNQIDEAVKVLRKMIKTK